MAANTGIINKTFVSAIDTMLDTREIYKKITDVPNEGFVTDMLVGAGYKRPVTQFSYHNFEAETVFSSLVVNGPVTNNGTGTVTFTTTAATAGVVRLNDLVLLPGTDSLTGHVQTITNSSGNDIVVIKSPSATNMTLAGGDILSIYSVAVGEKSAARQNIKFGMPKRSNKVQIFSETSSITDVQAASTIEVTIPGESVDKQGYLMYDHLNKILKLKGGIEAQKWAGEMSSTTMSDASPALVDQYTTTGGGSGPVQTTRGIDKYIAAYGTTVAATVTLGTPILTDIDAVLDALIAARASTDYWVCLSKKAKRANDKMWKAMGSASIQSVRVDFNGKGMDFDVDRISYGGFNLHYMPTPIFDHPTLLGNSLIAKNAYYMPVDAKVKTFAGGYEPSMSVVYIKNQGKLGDELINESEDGALAPRIPAGTVQQWITHWVTKQGLELLGPSFYMKQRVTA